MDDCLNKKEGGREGERERERERKREESYKYLHLYTFCSIESVKRIKEREKNTKRILFLMRMYIA